MHYKVWGFGIVLGLKSLNQNPTSALFKIDNALSTLICTADVWNFWVAAQTAAQQIAGFLPTPNFFEGVVKSVRTQPS